MAIVSSGGREPDFAFKVLGKGSSHVFDVLEFSLRERMSSPFELTLMLVSEDGNIPFDDIVGQESLLKILDEKTRDPARFVHGVVRRFENTGDRSGGKGRFHLYRAEVVPSVWFLSLERDCRIFQKADQANNTVMDVVKQVFKDAGLPADRFAYRLKGDPPAREYCVQYRESDLDFVSRLLEEEGIFHHFEHDEKKHVTVFGNDTSSYGCLGGGSTPGKVKFNITEKGVPKEECVYDFTLSRSVRTGKVTRRDFHFEKVSLDQTTDDESRKSPKLDQKYEAYDYPGGYIDPKRGKALAQVRLQEAQSLRETCSGKSTSRGFLPGHKFELTDHDNTAFNRIYLLVEVVHEGYQPQVLHSSAAAGPPETEEKQFHCTNTFVGIPADVVFRPSRETPRPVVEGPHTALVVGPKGEEIYTDEYGRVKVHFHWDRLGKRDEKSSCWIRVASMFAGSMYGAIFIPRIGQEVIVGFLEGDPDRPIVTGRVYNADCMPPYDLPQEKTKSTIKTDTSPGGKGFNEIRFEDLKDQEQIFMHGQRNLDVRIEKDAMEWIGQDRHLIVKKDQLELVEGDKHQAVKGDHNEKVDGTVSLKVGMDMQEKVGMKHALDAGMEIHLKAGMKVVIEAGVQLTLKAAGSFVDIGPAGVAIQGVMVNINSGGSAGSGSGSSPDPPKPPVEADKAKPGSGKTTSAPASPPPPTPQAQALKSSAKSGTPFCET
jgi:type VI secretion system secreted protein VgrG